MEQWVMRQAVRRRNRYASDNRRRPCSKAPDPIPIPIPSPNVPTCLSDQYGNPKGANGQRVTHCPDGSFCCGTGSVASHCCNRRGGVFVINGTITAPDPSPSAPESRTSSPPSWSPHTSLPLPSVTTISHHDPTNGVSSPTSLSSQLQRPNHLVPIIAGILGGVIGIFIFIGTIIWLIRRKRKGLTKPNSIEDSIVILDTARTTPTRQQSRRGKHHQPVHHTRRIDGTVRPPEFEGMAENETWDRVIFVDQMGGAVRQMGF
ncbi:MAG: hypothetical protein Q9226_005844 [Calogaya cf. arnoldii]